MAVKNSGVAVPTLQGEEPVNLVDANSGSFPHEVIAERAYALWEERDGTSGDADQDWFRAEESLRTLE